MKFSLSSVFTGTRCPGPTAPPGVAAMSRAQLAWKRSRSLHIHLPALHSEGHANTATVNKQKPRKMPHRRVLAPEMQRKELTTQLPAALSSNEQSTSFKKGKENLITALQLAKQVGEGTRVLVYIHSYFWLHWVSVVVCKLRKAGASLAAEHRL